MASRIERAAEASFSLAVWARERNCVVCGEPGSNAHHVLYGSNGRSADPRGGVMLCGSGTTGCHGAYHDGDVETARTIAEHIVMNRPDTIDFLRENLAFEDPLHFLQRVYHWEPEPIGV